MVNIGMSEFWSGYEDDFKEFEKDWKEANKINPKDYPLEMNYNDWIYYFTCWVDNGGLS